MSFNIDFCDFKIAGNLEKLSIDFPILNYKWGNFWRAIFIIYFITNHLQF